MEMCLYKLPTKGPERDAAGKMGARWRRGIFLGFNRMSSEYLLWDEGKVAKARAVQRIKKHLRWPVAAYNSVRHGPNCMYEALEHEQIVGDPEKVKDPYAEGDLGRKPQDVQIRQADWLQHGATTGCAKCFSALEKGWGIHIGSHSKECLERYKAIYSNSAEGRLRLERAEQRLARRTTPQNSATNDAAEAAKTRGRDVAGGETPVTPPLRDPADSSDEPKCPTSDDEGDAAMDNWEATSAESDEEMPPVSDINAIEIDILQLVEHLGGSRAKYSRQMKMAHTREVPVFESEVAKDPQVVTEVYSPPRVTDWAKRFPKIWDCSRPRSGLHYAR